MKLAEKGVWDEWSGWGAGFCGYDGAHGERYRGYVSLLCYMREESEVFGVSCI